MSAARGGAGDCCHAASCGGAPRCEVALAVLHDWKVALVAHLLLKGQGKVLHVADSSRLRGSGGRFCFLGLNRKTEVQPKPKWSVSRSLINQPNF